jgi:hypothetical protein
MCTDPEFLMVFRTLFIGAAVMVITVFRDTTSLATEHIADAIQEMSVGRVIIEVMLFSEGNLLGERFITRGNPPYLLMADRIFP